MNHPIVFGLAALFSVMLFFPPAIASTASMPVPSISLRCLPDGEAMRSFIETRLTLRGFDVSDTASDWSLCVQTFTVWHPTFYPPGPYYQWNNPFYSYPHYHQDDYQQMGFKATLYHQQDTQPYWQARQLIPATGIERQNKEIAIRQLLDKLPLP